MTPSKPTRGRPKGTGLDDFDQLKAIAGLLTSEPELKPTTAIRRLGIQDPSVIRRLRDKFNACQAELMAELRESAGVARHVVPDGTSGEAKSGAGIQAAAIPHESSRTAGRVIALAAEGSPRISQPILVAAPKASRPAAKQSAAAIEPVIDTAPPARRERAPRAIPLPSETKLPEWIGVGMSVYVMSMEAQFAVIGTLFEWPPLAAVLRSQIAFAEMAVSASRPAFPSLGLAAQVRP